MNWVMGIGGAISVALAAGLVHSHQEVEELEARLASALERIEAVEERPEAPPPVLRAGVADVERSLAELAEISTEKFRIIEALSTRLARAERRIASSRSRSNVRNAPIVVPPANQNELEEAVDTLRADVDSILSGEAAAAQLVAAAVAAAEADDTDSEAQAAAPGAPVAAAPPTDREVTPEQVVDALDAGLRQSWIDDYATSSRLSPRQRTELQGLMGGLHDIESNVVRDVLEGSLSPHDARVKLREAVVDANSEMRDLLDSRQRSALRTELQRRNDLSWSLFLGR